MNLLISQFSMLSSPPVSSRSADFTQSRVQLVQNSAATLSAYFKNSATLATCDFTILMATFKAFLELVETHITNDVTSSDQSPK